MRIFTDPKAFLNIESVFRKARENGVSILALVEYRRVSLLGITHVLVLFETEAEYNRCVVVSNGGFYIDPESNLQFQRIIQSETGDFYPGCTSLLFANGILYIAANMLTQRPLPPVDFKTSLDLLS